MRWLKLGAAVVLVVALGLAAWLHQAYQELQDAALVEETQHLLVERGTPFAVVARELGERGWIEHPWLLRAHGRLSGDSGRIKAGEYAVEPGLTALELLEKMVRGEVVQHGFTLVEGWTFKQLRTALEAHPVLEPTLKGLSDTEVMAKLGHAGEHPEGRFLPETYFFPRGTTDVEFLRRAYVAMQRRLEAEWADRAEGLPLKNPYEALVLASIIERETAVPSERDEIAGVFVRRLQRGMRLQTDPTVIYGMGDRYDGDIRYRDLRRDTPYNTYTRAGLPPTPIAMPSGDAIHAALHPKEGDSLYFVSRGDGSHKFSATLKEHNRAVRHYQLNRGR